MIENTDLIALKAENKRLITLLEQHGILWRLPKKDTDEQHQKKQNQTFSTQEKVAIFRRLFRGRTDVYPVRWESRASNKSGYSPACANEWREGVCDKPRIKCADCNNRSLIPLTDDVIYDHLAGEHTIGVYPLLEDDCCYFLAVDFDDEHWQEDACSFIKSCDELGVSSALEISRSGNGAHVWIFFEDKVFARDARKLGTALISRTCARTRQLKLNSYDRLFPNQDMMPRGGFGNLIALPLQKRPREKGFSVFVNSDFQTYEDQWAFLASIKPIAINELESIVSATIGNNHPLDVTFIEEEDLVQPWKQKIVLRETLTGILPKSLNVVLSNLIYFEKQQLTQSLANRLIRIAAFQNPEFYKAQAMRMSVWDKPRIICNAINFPKHIALPRGCLEATQVLLKENNIALTLIDERIAGEPIEVKFKEILRSDQKVAVTEMLAHDFGVLCAPTAFGKTVVASALIAERKVNTLILVHRTELLKQWHERLQTFLGIGKEILGTIGGGKSKPTGKIDIALMQSLSRKGEVNNLVENYGHIIVDECHHVGAASFDLILKKTKAKFVLGLTATPIRRDGQQPIIFMQCGSIRHIAKQSFSAHNNLVVNPISSQDHIDLPKGVAIQEVFSHLTKNSKRTQAIVDEIKTAFELNRKVLVLTERTDHLQSIHEQLRGFVNNLFLLHSKLKKKERSSLIEELNSLDPNCARVLLSTGKLIGEGFDHAPLDTLVLAMPVSWRGTLQQYAGRLHREHTNKKDVRIIDFVDTGHPALNRMWIKRQSGYKNMGYKIQTKSNIDLQNN